ncbi:PrsW family glutamic-type intramembrane protease [Candidatus Absconditicoccus praedator]|uniref:PrsW family glutamic-type intramembrane protease n=1 Tax=Candidatus Absconditicoccus praedator TaxID=2735562 RepID=UPI001E360E63|nr:PrsW family glutamic-type intramembrane protease [Candidatus Absconditicoccus praedator]UFX83507.1 PrsW family intramembrane metalloprotease [Candidatus Absconditicoccus praedator]
MEAFFLLGIVGFLVLVYWLRGYIREATVQEVMVGVVALLGGVFSASLVLFLGKLYDLKEVFLYSSLVGPFVEELSKFLVVLLVYIFFKKQFENSIWALVNGILVGLGFGFYENIIYISYGVDDVWITLYRSLIVGGLLVHPLTAGIYGYMFYLSERASSFLPSIFDNEKREFCVDKKGIIELIKYVYYNGKNSLKDIIKLFWSMITIQTTVYYIIENNYNNKSHSPLELIYEGLFLGVWIHILYNSLLGFISEPDFYIGVVGVVGVLFLLRVFVAVFHSWLLGILISGVILLGFLRIGPYEQLLILSLIILLVTLFILSWEINQKINSFNR